MHDGLTADDPRYAGSLPEYSGHLGVKPARTDFLATHRMGDYGKAMPSQQF